MEPTEITRTLSGLLASDVLATLAPSLAVRVSRYTNTIVEDTAGYWNYPPKANVVRFKVTTYDCSLQSSDSSSTVTKTDNARHTARYRLVLRLKSRRPLRLTLLRASPWKELLSGTKDSPSLPL